MTFSFVPDALNILPMYIVLLALVPLAIAASRFSPWLAVAASVALWGVVQLSGLNLPAGGAPGRMWFFDPFAWQLLFFTGFAFGMRWVNAPRLDRPELLSLSVAVIALSVPINFWGFTDNLPILASIRDRLIPDGLAATTQLHVLRYAHFLCLAYAALSLLDRRTETLGSPYAAPILAIGRRSLAAFGSSVIFAWIAGVALDATGRGFFSVAAVNLAGFCALFAVAQGTVLINVARNWRSSALDFASAFVTAGVGPGIGRPDALRPSPRSERPRVSPFDLSLAKQPTERSATNRNR